MMNYKEYPLNYQVYCCTDAVVWFLC